MPPQEYQRLAASEERMWWFRGLHANLIAARRCYEKAGFTLTSSEKRHSWGKDVVAEFWDLEL